MLSPEFVIRTTIILAVALLGLSVVLSMFGRRRAATATLSLFLLSCTVFFGTRAYLKGFFPFTDKVESFVTLSVLIVACGMVYRNKIANREFTALLLLAFASAATVFVFNDQIRYPTPYLLTLWYPLHVPLSFAAYAFWFIAGVNALFSFRAWRARDPSLPERPLMTDLNRIGFLCFTVAMLFGGIWAYLAWGDYFMWDPKLVWSAILWLYYGNLLHIDALPAFRRWKIPLYILGVGMILITFIGTGFFTRSIHKF
jgi:ABC-type transport system involved in cytochrome c biogenesis permease subunit